MKYFAPSYLITTSLALLSSSAPRLAGTFPTGENTTAKASNNSSGLAITPNQHTDFTNQYFDEAFIKIIKEAANAPTYPDHTAEKLKLERAERSKLIEHETPVNGDDLVSLFAEPAENSDVVHHRGKRAMQNEKITSYVTLENGNCVGILLKTVPTIKPYQELRAKCFNERCNNQQFDGYQADYLLEKDQIYTASASTLNPQEAKIEYSYGTRQFQNQMVKEECEGILGMENIGGSNACSRMQSVESIEKSTDSIVYLCPSDAYQHVQNAKTLALNGNTTKAMEEIGMALNIRPNYKPAMDLQAKILESLASTTIEPSTSSAENSTPTVNSTTITEKTTPNLEPHNAPFERNSVPTAAPHEQTTKGQGWSMQDILTAAGSAAIAVITVGGIATYIYKKGTAIYHACQEHCSKLEETSLPGELYSTFAFVTPKTEDTNLMGTGSEEPVSDII